MVLAVPSAVNVLHPRAIKPPSQTWAVVFPNAHARQSAEVEYLGRCSSASQYRSVEGQGPPLAVPSPTHADTVVVLVEASVVTGLAVFCLVAVVVCEVVAVTTEDRVDLGRFVFGALAFCVVVIEVVVAKPQFSSSEWSTQS
jgi:hypothetical protein